jgi:D-alanyl-D-alanine carboxypeptidase
MARVARYAMQNEKFREIVATEKYTVTLPGRGEPLTFKSTNQLLGKVDWVTGVKTGLTPKAEQCFVGSGAKDGVNIISVVLGQPEPDVCFGESKALLQYGLAQYRFVTLLDKGVVVAEAKVPYQLDGVVQLVPADAVDMELYKEDSVTTSIVLEEPLVLPVTAGEVFGEVTLTVDGAVVDTVDLVAAQSYGKTSLGSKIVYFWQRLGRAVGRVF